MKNIIKGFLELVGLSNVAKNLSEELRLTKKQKQLQKYKNIKIWHLKYRNLSLSYDVSNLYAKGWFYPRYDNGKIHEPMATDVFIDHIKNNSQVLDIGGHLGYFSCIAGKLAINGKVHVFEVDPNCINFIKKNLTINNLDNVEINNCAVANSGGTVKIPKNENPNPELVINSTSSDDYIEVETKIIDDFLTQNNFTPDFIKIDIEGAEGMALEGMKNTLANSSPTLLIEIHVNNLQTNFHTDYKEVLKLLLKYGYTLEEIEHRESEGKARLVDLNTELEGNTMILCQKATK
ncbi:MAG: FkbM family methyltransferase [Cyclobacteriaceae bacterium]|nr:FkbM family methyltransferase [Cyclobacteriaceae bacterium HetDA_MAG_MS6]